MPGVRYRTSVKAALNMPYIRRLRRKNRQTFAAEIRLIGWPDKGDFTGSKLMLNFKRKLLAASMGLALVGGTVGCASSAGNGALIGGATGAGIGAIVGHNSHGH